MAILFRFHPSRRADPAAQQEKDCLAQVWVVARTTRIGIAAKCIWAYRTVEGNYRHNNQNQLAREARCHASKQSLQGLVKLLRADGVHHNVFGLGICVHKSAIHTFPACVIKQISGVKATTRALEFVYGFHVVPLCSLAFADPECSARHSPPLKIVFRFCRVSIIDRHL